MPPSDNLYRNLSIYYDKFCDHVDYDAQCDFALRAYQLFAESNIKNYYDLACGTGKHLQCIAKQGFQVTGLDNSQEMLDQAAIRCPGAELICCDLAEFTQLASFDLITCFLYSTHYSYPSDRYLETLKRAYQALTPGGIFVFDAVDKMGIKNDACVAHSATQGNKKLNFQSRWYYSGEGDILDLHLTIQLDDSGLVQQWRDHHLMTALDIPSIKTWMETIGFEVFILERDFTRFTEWDGDSANVMVVGKKSGAG